MFMLSDLSSFPGRIAVPLRLRMGHIADPAYTKVERLGSSWIWSARGGILDDEEDSTPSALMPGWTQHPEDAFYCPLSDPPNPFRHCHLPFAWCGQCAPPCLALRLFAAAALSASPSVRRRPDMSC
jgi:hypothetical protein